MDRLEIGRKNAKRWLPLIVGLAVGIRMGLAIAHPFEFPDSADYDALARGILGHRPYEVGGNIASRMPGYPVFVAGVYAVGGGTQAVLITQAVLSSVIVLLTYGICKRIGGAGGGVAGLMAAAMVAIDPLSIGFSAALLTEMPFTLLLMVSLWICLGLMERPGLSRWILLGVLWGAAVTMRASALWCIVPLAGWTAWQSGRSAFRGRAAVKWMGPVVAIGIVFLVLLPWMARNYRHFHSGPLRLTTLEGISLYEAVYPAADGGPQQDKIVVPAEMVALNEAERNDEWARRGWGYVMSDPLRVAKLGVIKVGRTWSPALNAVEFRNPLIQAGMMIWYVPMFILGLIGLMGGRMARSARVLLCVPLVYFTLVHAIFLGSVRYRVPLMPIVCIFAASGIAKMWNLRKGAKPPAEIGV